MIHTHLTTSRMYGLSMLSVYSTCMAVLLMLGYEIDTQITILKWTCIVILQVFMSIF